jgi:hypothetical protein
MRHLAQLDALPAHMHLDVLARLLKTNAAVRSAWPV